MKLHIVGSGGRAHVLVWKLAQSPKVTSVVCAPGNAGIAMERLQNGKFAQCVPVSSTDIKEQLVLANTCDSDITICQEDAPLALGIVDLFQAAGRKIWGPNRKAARFESSKIWAWEFMQKYGIPTPLAKPCENFADALIFAQAQNFECAIKVDGLAMGKGVFICRTQAEVIEALCRIFLKREFGSAGKRVLVQKLVYGQELSLHFLCSGGSAVVFPSSKDHKRALEGDTGEMTGGMGAVSPSPDIKPCVFGKVAKMIVEPWLAGCEAEGIDFRGILYPGVMLTKEGPVVLEFNARFGDPETQVYLTRLENDLLGLIEASVDGRDLSPSMLKWSDSTSVCVVMAAPGYPETPVTGKEIIGLEKVAALSSVKVFHAGTALQNGRLVTSGGRVLGVTAWALNLQTARLRAYQAAQMIKFKGGQHFRRDIGGPVLNIS